MIESTLNQGNRFDPYGRQINREPSPVRANTLPYLSIMLGSFLPMLLISSTMPSVPPIGYMMLVGWRLMRPGLMPSWAGMPLGLFDDLISGQPFGSAILLWSVTMLAIEWFEIRFPWRGVLQDWVAAAIAGGSYVLLAMLVSGAGPSLTLLLAIWPQLVMTALLYPVIALVIAGIDRFRLRPIREIN